MERACSGDRAEEGSNVVALARGWIGTPYQHQASCKGAGTDCLGLLRGIWRELFGAEPERVPAYTPDWSEPDRAERLLEAAARHMVPVSIVDVADGDVLILRMAEGSVAKHVGIRASDHRGAATIIHAYSGHGVVESPLTLSWNRRIAGVFRFSGRRG